ncbi:hypothetical protein GCM10009114_07510 [Aliiglaciecola litoralis]|uniref:Uncharacterized protein n=1 Tax=Aliiglaciecola litoralis TaxID=582857 RepID=A0ABP3WNV6_9ALTE
MDDVSEQFKPIQKRFYVILLLTAVFFSSGFILQYFGIEFLNPFYGALIGVLIFNVGIWLYYRCPKCNSVPFALGSEGVEIRPKSCHKCGSKFR